MRLIRLTTIAAVIATLSASAAAAPIFGLYNTGVDNSGTLLANGAVDSHWAGSVVSSTGTYALTEKAQTTGYPIVPYGWLGYDGLSSWLTYTPTQNALVGTYDLRTTFDLSGIDLSSVSISGKCSVDNYSTGIKLNGQLVSNATCAGFNAWSNFALTSGFVSGINTLDFFYVNSGSQEGFRAEFDNVSGRATNGDTGNVPEPASLALLGLGLAGLSASRRRKTA